MNETETASKEMLERAKQAAAITNAHALGALAGYDRGRASGLKAGCWIGMVIGFVIALCLGIIFK